MSAYLQQFAERFAHLDVDSLDSLNTLYSEDVVFRDPCIKFTGSTPCRPISPSCTPMPAISAMPSPRRTRCYLARVTCAGPSSFVTHGWHGGTDNGARLQFSAVA